MAEYGTMRVKSGLAEMLKGGVIMDVVDAGQDEGAHSLEVGEAAHLAHLRPERPEDTRMRGEVALQGEDADGGAAHQPRSCRRSPEGMAATSRPRMGSPRPREASATARGSA